MKALKEKRNSFRSLWRMGLVILSVLALAFAACGDSNTGNPVTPPPPVNPDNGNGGDTDPPPVAPPANPVERIVVTTNPTQYSKEGQRASLNGAVIEVWYKGGGVEKYDTNAALSANFVTVPAILGEAQILSVLSTGAANTVSGEHSVAVLTPISVYHKDHPSVMGTVVLPGVRAIKTGATDGNATRGAGDNVARAGQVFGNGTDGSTAGGFGVRSSGNLGGLTVFEDGDVPDVAGRYSVMVRYEEIWQNAAGQRLERNNDNGLAENGAWNSGHTGSPGTGNVWESVPLTADHIFSDYNNRFRQVATRWDTASDASLARPGRNYAYGIDTDDGAMYFMISRGRQNGNTSSAVSNSSIYVRKTVEASTNFYYIRAVEVAELTWESSEPGKYSFLTQAEALEVRDWTSALTDRNIKLRVYYDGYDKGYEDRDVSYWRRAVRDGRAGVINTYVAGDGTNQGPATGHRNSPTPTADAVTVGTVPSIGGDSGEDGFGQLLIGYYSSHDYPADFNPIGVGDFTNVAIYNLPIATYNEGSGFLRKKASAKEPGNLVFQKSGGQTGAWSGPAVAGSQLMAIQNTYDFCGTFTYQGQTVEGIIIPGDDFRRSFFAANALNSSNTEIEDVEVSFTVPNNIALNNIRTGSGTDNDKWHTSTSTDATVQAGIDRQNQAKYNKYYFFRGEDTEFTVTIYP